MMCSLSSYIFLRNTRSTASWGWLIILIRSCCTADKCPSCLKTWNKKPKCPAQSFWESFYVSTGMQRACSKRSIWPTMHCVWIIPEVQQWRSQRFFLARRSGTCKTISTSAMRLDLRMSRYPSKAPSSWLLMEHLKGRGQPTQQFCALWTLQRSLKSTI